MQVELGSTLASNIERTNTIFKQTASELDDLLSTHLHLLPLASMPGCEITGEQVVLSSIDAKQINACPREHPP